MHCGRIFMHRRSPGVAAAPLWFWGPRCFYGRGDVGPLFYGAGDVGVLTYLEILLPFVTGCGETPGSRKGERTWSTL